MTYPDPLYEPSPPATSPQPYRPAGAATPTGVPDQPPSPERRPAEPPRVRPNPPNSGGTRTVPPAHRAYRPGGAHDPEYDAMQRQLDRIDATRRATKDIAVGIVWLIGGVLVTVLTMAADTMFYIVAWGPMVYGLYRILKGVVTFLRR